MTLDELKTWIKSAKAIDSTGSVYDSSSNEEHEVIYEKDGKFYRVSYLNGHPYEKWDDQKKGFIRGEYEITPVRKASWIEYRHCWLAEGEI